jgi:predicted nuclease of predicted toxin-antitoxin system
MAEGLRAAGHDAVHLRDISRQSAEDPEVLTRARNEGRVIVSTDMDFAQLLAVHEFSRPSIILFRRVQRKSEARLALLLGNLDAVKQDREMGSIVILESWRIRIRRLPIGPTKS